MKRTKEQKQKKKKKWKELLKEAAITSQLPSHIHRVDSSELRDMN